MKISRKPLLRLFGLMACLCQPLSAAAQDKWHSLVDLGLKPGNNRSLALGNWFVPLSQTEDWLLFWDVRGQASGRDALEFGTGLGYRQLYSGWIVGGWGFFDRRKSKNGNAFNQISFGFEALSDAWDVRLNGYAPDPKNERLPELDRMEMDGRYVAVRLGEERALPGLDFELGYRLPIFQETRLYGGGFHFFGTGNFDGVRGPRVRLESRFRDIGLFGAGSDITFGLEVSNDSRRDTEASGFVRLRVALGAKQELPRLSSLERRMADPVTRNVDNITGIGLSDPVRGFASHPTTGERGDVAVLNAADSNAVHDIVASMPEYTAFIVSGEVRTSETIAAREGQSFIGAGRPLIVHFFEPDGRVGRLGFTPAGTTGTFVGADPSKDVIRVPANVAAANILEGMTISGGRDGISDPDEPGGGDNEAKVSVRGSIIKDVAGRGIDIGDMSELKLDGVSIRDTGDEGIFAGSENAITMANTTIERSGKEGMKIGNRNVLDIAGLDISNAARRGMNLGEGNDTTVADSAIRDAGHEGIALSGGGNALAATGMTIDNVGTASNQDGIQVTGGGNAITLTAVTITGTTNDGIRVTGGGDVNTLRFSGLVVSGVSEGGDGIQIDRNADAAMSDVRVSGTEGDGIRFDGADNVAVMTDVRVSDAGGDGIRFDGADNVAVMTDVRVSDAGGDGVAFHANSTATLLGVEVLRSGGSGLRFGDGNNVTIAASAARARSTVDGAAGTDSGDGGLAAGVGNVLDIAGLDISNAARRGMNLGEGNDTTVADSAIRDAGHEGIALSGGGNALAATGMTIDNVGTASNQDGIQVTGGGNAITLTAVTITGTTNDGIRVTGGGDVNTLRFSGLVVSGVSEGGDGIQIDRNADAAMSDVRVSGTEGDGIRFDGADNVAVMTDVRVSDAGGDGVAFHANSTATLLGVEVLRSGGSGLRFGDGNNVTIAASAARARSTVDGAAGTDSGDGGLAAGVGNVLDIAGLDISNAARRGMNLGEGNDTTVADSAIRDAGHEGIALSGGGNALAATGMTIDNVGTASNQDGIQVTGGGNAITLTAVTITGTTNDGIRVTGDASGDVNTLRFSGLVVSGVSEGGDGIHIDRNNALTLTDSRFTDIDGATIRTTASDNTLADGGGNATDVLVCSLHSTTTGSVSFGGVGGGDCPP